MVLSSRSRGKIAYILAIYVDDQIIHTGYERNSWAASHKVAMYKACLGIQDTARNRRTPSQSEGAWEQSTVHTNNTDVGLLVSIDTWENMKSIVLRLQAQVLENPEVDLCTNSIMSDIGTLGYGNQTYEPLTPHLKGLHLTIDGWRPGRYYDGWKVETARLKPEKVTEAEFFLNSASYLETFKPAKRLLSDLKALVDLMSIEISLTLPVDSSKIQYVKYDIGDASGGGFG